VTNDTRHPSPAIPLSLFLNALARSVFGFLKEPNQRSPTSPVESQKPKKPLRRTRQWLS
jgi:hypothetical protein